MNWRYVVIFAVIFVPFIMMGNNPFEPPEGYVPPDEFKDGITSRISEPSGFGPGSAGLTGGGFGSPTGGSFGTFQNGPASANPSQNVFQNPASNANQPLTSNSFYPDANGQGGQQQQNNNPLSNQLPPPSQGNAPAQLMPRGPEPVQPSYNAPAPFQNLPTPGSKMELPKGYPLFKEKSGKVIAFLGADVMTADEHGIAQLLPDGQYSLSNGHPLIIKEGKKWWPKNANKITE